MIENILLILLIVLLGAKLLGAFFQRIGMDSSIGELLTGIILGVSVLNLVEAKSIEDFALIGSVLILFVAGLKQQDIEQIYKDKKSLLMGLIMLIGTALFMTLFFFYVPRFFNVNLSIIQAIVMAIAFSVIDIGVPAKVLISKNLIDTPLGKMILRSSIVNIILGLFLFTFITVLISANFYDFLIKLLGMIAFFGFSVLLVYVLSIFSKYVGRSYVEEAEFSLALILILALAYFTEVIGFSSVLGAFIAGTIIAKMPFAETTSFTHKIKSLAFGLFVPLFFVWFGLEINLLSILQNLLLIILVFLAYVTLRFVIAYIFMKINKLPTPGLASSSLLSVDVESLVIIIVALNLGIFTDNIALTLFAPSVLFSTLLTIILVPLFSRLELKVQNR